MRLALYQPDIPQNLGTLLRLGACLDVAVDVIEPCGFPFSDRSLKRAGMDYADHVRLIRHAGWTPFLTHGERGQGALVLLTTKAERSYLDYRFQPGDTLLLGRESAGVPDEVHARADVTLRVPMAPGLRSLNVAVCAAIVLGEALRQTGHLAALHHQASKPPQTFDTQIFDTVADTKDETS